MWSFVMCDTKSKAILFNNEIRKLAENLNHIWRQEIHVNIQGGFSPKEKLVCNVENIANNYLKEELLVLMHDMGDVTQ
jgi:hypothetical protein